MTLRCLLVLAAVLLGSAGCRSVSQPGVSLVTPLRAPLVLRQNQRGLDAHGANYLYLTPLAVGAEEGLLLWIGHASTVPTQVDGQWSGLRLLLDGEAVDLALQHWEGDELWITDAHPVRRRLLVSQQVAVVDAELLNRIGRADDLAAAVMDGRAEQRYEPWTGRWQDWAVSAQESEVRMEAQALQRPLLPPGSD